MSDQPTEAEQKLWVLSEGAVDLFTTEESACQEAMYLLRLEVGNRWKPDEQRHRIIQLILEHGKFKDALDYFNEHRGEGVAGIFYFQRPIRMRSTEAERRNP